MTGSSETVKKTHPETSAFRVGKIKLSDVCCLPRWSESWQPPPLPPPITLILPRRLQRAWGSFDRGADFEAEHVYARVLKWHRRTGLDSMWQHYGDDKTGRAGDQATSCCDGMIRRHRNGIFPFYWVINLFLSFLFFFFNLVLWDKVGAQDQLSFAGYIWEACSSKINFIRWLGIILWGFSLEEQQGKYSIKGGLFGSLRRRTLASLVQYISVPRGFSYLIDPV